MDIEKMSLDELIDLNKRVIRRIEYLHGLKTRSQLDRFEIGDRVGFQNEGRTVEGTVIRVNRKTLSVKTKEGSWNVPPRFVTRISPTSNATNAPPTFLPIEKKGWSTN